jgi:hypothetical protein
MFSLYLQMCNCREALHFAAYEQYRHFQLGALPHSCLKCLSREALLMYVLLQVKQQKLFGTYISDPLGRKAFISDQSLSQFHGRLYHDHKEGSGQQVW